MADTVAKAAVDLLAEAGVRNAYTVPGESFLGLLDELGGADEDQSPIRLVSARHESGAAFMAEAEAKLTGRPALALASRGPGAANLAIGIHTAMQDQTPLIAILGQVESALRGRPGMTAFQEVDLAAFYAPIAKWAAEAQTAKQVVPLLAEAYARATSGRPGPVAVSVPADFWERPYDGTPIEIHTEQPTTPDHARRVAATLAELLAKARRPVAIAGPGVRVGRAELRRAAERHGFGVYVAFRRQDAFDEDDPHFLGHLGLAVPDDVRRGLDDADLLLVLGTRLDAMSFQDFRYPRPEQQLVLLGRDLPVPELPRLPVVLNTDPRPVLGALGELDRPAGSSARADWTDQHAAATRFAEPGDVTTRSGVHPADVVTTLRRLAPDDAILTNDAGNFSGFLHRYWRFTTSHRLLGPSNGAMGYAVPAAVAAKLESPDRTVVAFVGDGGVLMTGQEVETAVRLRAPIVVLAFQNGLYGTIAMHQARAHGRLAGVDIGQLDLARWALGLGACGLTLDDPADVEPVLSAAISCERACVVDVRMDPDVIAPDRRLSDLLPGSLNPVAGPRANGEPHDIEAS